MGNASRFSGVGGGCAGGGPQQRQARIGGADELLEQIAQQSRLGFTQPLGHIGLGCLG